MNTTVLESGIKKQNVPNQLKPDHVGREFLNTIMRNKVLIFKETEFLNKGKV